MRPHGLLTAAASTLAAAAVLATSAGATTARFVAVDDPIVGELRVLDLYAPGPERSRLLLAHPGSGPWQVLELLGGAESDSARASGPRAIALARIRRALERDAGADAGAPRSTPRLFQRAWPGDERAEFSLGLEGAREMDRTGGDSHGRWRDGSGVHARIGLQVDRWLAYSHLFFGELRGVRAFSDALVANTDVAASTDESYLAYTAGTAWSAQLGRSRWAWGPGEAGSLLLSPTAAPVNGLLLHLHLEGLRADAFILDATVEPGTGEQLAAHRLEWRPAAWARVGVAEAARYHAGGWQGVYLAGAIPYAVAQRLLDREHSDSTGTLRNNVMMSADVSLRVADGSRLYGELLLDDMHARTAAFPNKYGWQAGWSGTGEIGALRLDWNTEYTWLSRYVYTSFFGRSYVSQDLPLGFPAGPDSRTFRARVSCDPAVDWQLAMVASRTRTGEGGLEHPFVPGTPVPDVATLAGTVEQVRALEGAVRWWPASGVDVSLRAGREWIANAGHVTGADVRRWRGTLAFALTR